MATKSSDWRPGPTVCRCCFAEGCYKDISTEYFWMGKREVYCEMLTETFDVTIAYSQAGGPNSNSRLICEPCISRLRDASDFKRQVVECEKTFMHHLDPGSSSVLEMDVHVEPADKEVVKLERVKLEAKLSDDDFDPGDDGGFPDDDDDDLDDEPLTKLASKVPKKESVDIMDLLDNSKAEKRKSTTKVKSSPAKKPKKKESPKPSASKQPAKAEKKKREDSSDPVRRNAELILRCTTAYPFRVSINTVLCVCCKQLFEDPHVFRMHYDSDHQLFTAKSIWTGLSRAEFVKVDITDLHCRLCEFKSQSIKDIAAHLKIGHLKDIDMEYQFGVIPYRLDKYAWNCTICGKNFPSLLNLNKHTISHFLNFVCDTCGKSYISSTGLAQHVRLKHENDYKAFCNRCRKIFPSMEARVKHHRTEKRCMPHCCTECPERFPRWDIKQRHMSKVHGIVKKPHHCAKCNISFPVRRTYSDHFKKWHSQDFLMCVHCELKFSTTSRLKRHLVKHTKVTLSGSSLNN